MWADQTRFSLCFCSDFMYYSPPAGVDEDVIIAILVKRNNEQRQKIKAVYEASTGKVSK